MFTLANEHNTYTYFNTCKHTDMFIGSLNNIPQLNYECILPKLKYSNVVLGPNTCSSLHTNGVHFPLTPRARDIHLLPELFHIYLTEI